MRGAIIRLVFATAVLVPATPARAARAGEVTALVQTALDAASTVPDGRVEILALERSPNTCAAVSDLRTEVPRPVDGSGRFAVKLTGIRAGGAPCEAWIWVRLRVLAQVNVATHSIRAGESFAGVTVREEREIKPGHLPAAALDGAVAVRSMGPGQMVEAEMAQLPGLRPGETVKVVLVAGSLSIEEIGRAVSCGRNHNCAVLPSGRHVDGALVDGRLMVELP